MNLNRLNAQRPRRNRASIAVRALVREHSVTVDDLIMPLFVIPGSDKAIEVPSMPGVFKLSQDKVIAKCVELSALGIKGVVVFPSIPDELKDSHGTESLNPNGLYLSTLKAIKESVPELLLITDVALDPYSCDGHDGLVDHATGRILNDDTLPLLAKMSVAQARAGADVIAPSDMMDGRVGYIREALDKEGFENVGIMSYSVKYASSFYGPFRDALDSAPRGGDKKTYQMDPANVREAQREISLDVAEGADVVMVKPGLPYLDVVRAVKEVSSVPVAVYNVSGEYAMVRAAAANGWLNYRSIVMETMTSFKRAGADMILTYHAQEVAQWLKEGMKN